VRTPFFLLTTAQQNHYSRNLSNIRTLKIQGFDIRNIFVFTRFEPIACTSLSVVVNETNLKQQNAAQTN